MKTKIFEKEMGQILNDLEEERIMADYVADPEFSPVDVKEHLKNAAKFIRKVERELG